jgi:hypothetical protein
MSFDPTTAKLAEEFDPSTAKPEEGGLHPVVNYNPGVGMVEGALSLGTGAAGSIAGGISGLGTIATNALGLTNTPPGDRVAQVAEALTYRPRTVAGEKVVEGVSMPFELLAKGADAAGGAVTDATGSPVAGTAVNTLINAAPMALGPLARGVPRESPAAIAARAKTKALNAPHDAGVALAREKGLAITPSEANAGAAARIIEGLSGEPRLAKGMSQKNAPTINAMIRRDVGLADDAPLTRDALAQIRKEEGAHYEAIKQTGRFGTDAKFQADLHAITKSFDTAAKDFAHRSENPFKKTLDGLNVKSMDAASAVEEVKLLRLDADKAYRTGDKQLGKAFKDAAQALDDQIDRHLKRHAAATNQPDLADAVAKYQAARTRIAKTYAADKALNETTGNINAGVYASELKKGKPLSGEGLAVGQFARQFQRSSQPAEKLGNTGPTIMDVGLSLIGKDALLLGARPIARQSLMSDLAQGRLTKPAQYGQPKIRRLQDLIAEIGDETAALGVPAGQR